MQTLQQQLIALNKRAHAASDAIKLIEKITGKKAIKNDEIAALEASLSACPEGRTKAGLAKRIETLKSSVKALDADLGRAERIAESVLDLAQPWTPIERPTATEGATGEPETEPPAATGTEGGEN